MQVGAASQELVHQPGQTENPNRGRRQTSFGKKKKKRLSASRMKLPDEGKRKRAEGEHGGVKGRAAVCWFDINPKPQRR